MALKLSLTDTPSEFLATWVNMGQARSTIRGYILAIRAAEDVRLLPECVRAIYWSLAKSGKPTPRQPYTGPCTLRLLRSRPSSPQEQNVAALACLNWLLFLKVFEELCITAAGLASDSMVPFITTKVSGHREVRRPLYGWRQSWVRFLRAYAPACCIPEGQPLVRGGGEAVEKTSAGLLCDSSHAGHLWHNLLRGGAAAAFQRPPNVPYFVSWGRWRRLPTALEYALRYCGPAVVGALEMPWHVGVQFGDGGLVVLWTNLTGDVMYANSERSTKSAASEVSIPIREGPSVSLLIWMWRKLKSRWTTLVLNLILRPHCQSLESLWRLLGMHQLPYPQPQRPSPSPQSSQQDTTPRPGSEESVRGVPRRLCRQGESVRQVELTAARRGSTRGSLVWAVPYLSEGIVWRAQRWACGVRGPADLTPSDGIRMGLPAGLPAKRLRIPKVSVKARAQWRGPVREVEGSLGSSPPEGAIRGIPSACDPVLRLARWSLQVLAPTDHGVRPLRRCDPPYVRKFTSALVCWFFECVVFFPALASSGVVLQCVVAHAAFPSVSLECSSPMKSFHSSRRQISFVMSVRILLWGLGMRCCTYPHPPYLNWVRWIPLRRPFTHVDFVAKRHDSWRFQYPFFVFQKSISFFRPTPRGFSSWDTTTLPFVASRGVRIHPLFRAENCII